MLVECYFIAWRLSVVLWVSAIGDAIGDAAWEQLFPLAGLDVSQDRTHMI